MNELTCITLPGEVAANAERPMKFEVKINESLVREPSPFQGPDDIRGSTDRIPGIEASLLTGGLESSPCKNFSFYLNQLLYSLVFRNSLPVNHKFFSLQSAKKFVKKSVGLQFNEKFISTPLKMPGSGFKMPRTSTDSPEIFQNHLLNPNFIESPQLDDADIFQSEDALSQEVYISPQVPKKSSQFG